MQKWTRRNLLKSAGIATVGAGLPSVLPFGTEAFSQTNSESKRPSPADRRFRNAAVEEFIKQTQSRIGDATLAAMFANCFPNTLDTTVEPGQFEGKPDTAVITGDIPAMWLRDSSAQVWPYLLLAAKDEALRALLEGVIHRQARCFAVTSLRQLAEIANAVLHDSALANQAHTLAAEVESALRQHAIAQTPRGTIWAYEVDGFGSQLLMDDSNIPSLLGLPYLQSSPDAALYERTRKFVWSENNPWFFRGTAGEGIGGPHEGKDMVWPMSQIAFALTSNSDAEISRILALLKSGSVGTGFIHESYNKDDAKKFTRAWFAWVNGLFGELIATLAGKKPALLK